MLPRTLTLPGTRTLHWLMVWMAGLTLAQAADPAGLERAKQLHTQLTATLQPSVKLWVAQEAQKIKSHPPLTEAAVRKDILARFAGQSPSDTDVNALIVLVLMETSKDAEADLKRAAAEMEANNKKKQALRELHQQQKAVTSAQRDQLHQETSGAAMTKAQFDSQKPVAGLNPNAGTQPGRDRYAPAGIPAQGGFPPDSSGNTTDSTSDLSAPEQLRLQLAMDRMAQAQALVSELLKKQSDTASNIVNNFK